MQTRLEKKKVEINFPKLKKSLSHFKDFYMGII